MRCLCLVFAVLFLGAQSWTAGLEEVGRLSDKDRLPGAEISAYVASQKMLVTTSGKNSISLISIANPSAPKILEIVSFEGEVPSVSTHENLLAVAEMNIPATSPGFVHLYQVQNQKLKKWRTFSVGAHPDMVAFSPDGKTLLVANEGEPDWNTNNDPEGSVGFIDLSHGVENATTENLNFAAFDSLNLVNSGVRVAGPGSYLQNLEPEYISFSPKGDFAFVSLQENNAVAKIDIRQKRITDIWPLGSVNHSQKGNEFDYRKDKKISLELAPVRGQLQPDGLQSFAVGENVYFLTADEGAMRDDFPQIYSDVIDARTLLSLGRLNQSVFTADVIQKMGPLPVDAANPCDGKEPCRYLNTFGGRSISLFDAKTGRRIWNSGNALEKILSEQHPDLFNWNAKKGKVKVDSRSDNMGPEPENVAIGKTASGLYAFVAVERSSGIAVFSLKNPEKPEILDFFANSKDRGPEGILFIPAEISPVSGVSLLVVGYEYSTSLILYKVFY